MMVTGMPCLTALETALETAMRTDGGDWGHPTQASINTKVQSIQSMTNVTLRRHNSGPTTARRAPSTLLSRPQPRASNTLQRSPYSIKRTTLYLFTNPSDDG